MSSNAPADWYDDPWETRLIRYWDGVAWSQQTAAKPAGQTVPAANGASVGESDPPSALRNLDRRRVRLEEKENARRAAEEAALSRRAEQAVIKAAREEAAGRRQAANEAERVEKAAAKQAEVAEALMRKESKRAELQTMKEEKTALARAKGEARSGAKAAKVATVEAFVDGTLVAGSDVAADLAYLMETMKQFDKAATAALEGDVELEEEHIRIALDVAIRGNPFGGGKLAGRRLQVLVAQGRLRIGAQSLGVIKPEGFFAQYGRKQSLGAVEIGGGKLEVFSDRVVATGEARRIDEYTQAQVYLDGTTTVSSRPTLTRMALLSPLPGTALIPGMALQKKQKHDNRQGQFAVGGRDWSFSVLISPADVGRARSLAEQINRNAEAVHALASRTSQAPELARVSDDLLTRLERIAALLASGAITDEEAATLKAKELDRR